MGLLWFDSLALQHLSPLATYETPITKKLGSLFSKPSDTEPHESEAQKTEVISDAEAAKIDEVSDVFSECLRNLWNYFLKYGDGQKLGLEDLVNLGIGDYDVAFHYETCDTSWFWASRPGTSAPEVVWAAENKPHMMVTIANMHENDDDSLLVNEIRVII
ncbi:hypothetical protein ZTR_06947 [Talaromyces verruculosus]|nr:hypothetical protein ZTR_06947 [Talaromyces verruculosus]